jgi:hypothetical protein
VRSCRWARPFAAGQITDPRRNSGSRIVGLTSACREQSKLRACGADDVTANRTPSAWMISLAIFLAQGQILFFVSVTFGEHKWSILAERRRFFWQERHPRTVPLPEMPGGPR